MENQNNKDSKIISKSVVMNKKSLGIGAFILIIAFTTALISLGLQALTGGLVSLILFLISLLFLISIECLSINENTLRFYKDYFLFKTGDYYNINNFTGIQIIYKIEVPKQNSNKGTVTNWHPVQYKSYYVQLISSFKHNLIIREFSDFKKASEFQRKISMITNLPIIEKERIK